MGGLAGPILAAVLVAAAGEGWLERLDEVPLPKLPMNAPTTAEAAAMFEQMVRALETEDRAALYRMIHSKGCRSIPPLPLTPESAEIVRQLKTCRILRPLFVTHHNEIIYFQFCEAAGERLETLFILQLDSDGQWRIR